MPDMTVLLVAAVATFFAGVSKGGFGSGVSFVAAPILSMVIDPRLAIGVLLPLLMLIDVVTVKSFWKAWHGPSALALCLGAVPGVAIAAAVYQIANADFFRLLIGSISLAYVAYEISRSRGWLVIGARPFSRVWGIATGMIAGFTSFVSHAGGPPVAVYLLGQGMGKTQYQATSALTFWVINVLKFVPYAFLGIFTVNSIILDMWLAPVAIASAYLGVWAHRIVPERLFFAITYTMLVGTGSKLIWDGLT